MESGSPKTSSCKANFWVGMILPEIMKQFGCSVFDGPFWGIISGVRRSTRFFGWVSVPQFDIRSKLFDFVVLKFDFCSKYTVVSFCKALRAASKLEKYVFVCCMLEDPVKAKHTVILWI